MDQARQIKRAASRVAVAMSGGVDSSVAAALLLEAGFEVVGVTAVLAADESTSDVRGEACGESVAVESNVRMAERVARQLGIPHRVVDLRAVFEREIMAPFLSEYVAGRTPSPCGLCNPRIKFGALWAAASGWGAGALATGHYARLAVDDDGVRHMHRGSDLTKDQSYFLFGLTQDHLAHAMFPVGEMTKHETRAYAVRRKLAARESTESVDLCFLQGQTPGSWIDERLGNKQAGGDIVDTTGRKLGEHKGIHHYTVGQRRGLGVAAGSRLFVTAIDAAANRVVLGPHDQAMSRRMMVDGVNWLGGSPPAEDVQAFTQIRYKHAATACRVVCAGAARVSVEFGTPQFAVTPGQIAAFYAGTELLGGGWIEEAARGD